MAQIKHNMEEEAKRIDGFKDDLSERTRIGMIRALQTVGRTAASDWLRGPRPDRLGIKGGDLIRAMEGTHAFDPGDEGSASTSKKQGWVKAWKVGTNVFGEIGVDVVSSGGFHYDEYWEKDGSAHDGPRPFMNPAGQQALSAGLLDRDLQDELNKAKLD